MRAHLGLDKPIYVQYALFLSKAVKGDFGRSIRTHRPVSESILEKFPNSFKLVAVSMIATFIFSIPLGVLAAVRKDTALDVFVRVLAGLGQSLPTFWVGLMLIHIFVVILGILPSSGMGSWKHYLMPAFCMGNFLMAGIVRLLRSESCCTRYQNGSSSSASAS